MGLNKDGQRAVQGVREKIKSKFFSEKTVISMTETDLDKDIKAKDSLKEGETYKDRNGQKWTRKNGTLSQVGESRLNLVNPMFCPKCEKIMGGPESKLNNSCFMKYQHCFDCQLKKEKKLKLEGKFEEWIERKANENRKAYLRDVEEWYAEWLANDKETEQFIMNSGGELETWIRDKGLTERQAEQIKEHIQKIKEKVKKDK